MSRTTRTILGVFLILSSARIAAAQGFPTADTPNPAGASISAFYGFAKHNILDSADKMPADQYDYRPVKEVRSFGEILGHVIDAQYFMCSSARNVPNPNGANLKPGEPSNTTEKSKHTKAELTAALKEVFAFCDPVFDGLTDASMGDKVTMFGDARPKSTPLVLSVAHLWEHYGNLTTYLREKGIVPPSTERNQKPPAKPAADAPKSGDKPGGTSR